MPTYEFRCPAGHQFDRLMKMSESVPELPCPECGETAVRQMSGGAGLVFKGSGFYLTDYGRNAHRTSGPASPGGASSGGESKPGGGDAKPAAESKPSKPASESKGSSSGKGSGSGSGGGIQSPMIRIDIDGNVLLFAVNPMWRMNTQGLYAIVMNAVMEMSTSASR